MTTRRTTALLAALVAGALAAPAPAGAQNPWYGKRLLNFAHQGGEFERPSNTMFAFERAHAGGADVLELDIHMSSDGEIVVIHDSSVDRTTNGTGSVYDKTLAELQALDAAYNFIPGRNAVRGQDPSVYPWRGVRTGQRPPPPGHTRDDFRIPTLEEVFARFPDVPINIEIKGRSDTDAQSFLRNAEALAAFINASGRTDDLIVVSFHDEAVDRFHQLAPRVPIAPGLAKTGAYIQTGAPPGDGYVALQVPPRFAGITVMTPEFVERAHRDGYAVHTWIDSSDENAAFYDQMFAMCADAIMTAYSDRLEGAMRQRGYLRPGIGGLDPCGPDSEQIRPCTLRARSPAAGGRASIVLRVRRKDRWRDRCIGSARLTVTRGGRTVRIASGRLSVGPGPATQKASLKLTRAGRLLLRRASRPKVESILRVKGEPAPFVRTITVRAPAR